MPSGTRVESAIGTSIWAAIHPRLLELIRAHRSTLIFVNSRRLAERLAGALNELAGETLVRSHHGSIAAAAARRGGGSAEGRRACARSSPPRRSSSASTWARSTWSCRSRRRPRSPAACSASAAAATRPTRSARASSSRSSAATSSRAPRSRAPCTRAPSRPRATRATRSTSSRSRWWRWRRWTTWDVDELFAVDPRAPRRSPSWAAPRSTACSTCCRDATRRTSSPSCARASPGTGSRGTIVGARGRQARRDRQRRHDPRPRALRRFPGRRRHRARRASASSTRRWSSRAASGETFVLGASSWRIEEITHDRVLVSPAPGAAGEDAVLEGRPRGPPAGARARASAGWCTTCCGCRRPAAVDRLTRDHDLDAARRREPAAVPARPGRGHRARVPDARDDRHRARARRAGRLARLRAVAARRPRCTRRGRWPPRRRSARRPASTSRRSGATTGSCVRFPDVDQPPDPRLLLPDPDEVQALVVAAARARRRSSRRSSARTPRDRCCCPSAGPGMRAPLWQQRKRAADLARGRRAVRIVSRPARDLPRMPARRLRHAGARRHAGRRPQPRSIRVATVDSETPSPFAASLLFSYVASFIYDGDAPLAERRAQALAVDQAQLRELIGDGGAARAARRRRHRRVSSVSSSGSSRDTRRRAPTACTTCCSRIGDLTADELRRARRPRRRRRASRRSSTRAARDRAARGAASRASSPSRTPRATATRSACRCRRGSRTRCSSRSRDPLGDLARRYARTHAPFTRGRLRGALRPRVAAGRRRCSCG